MRDEDLPAGFAEISRRIAAAEEARGASRVDPPEQEVLPLGDGRYELAFRPRRESESRNAALSLAANLAIADALFAAKTGLFRVMPEPDERAVKRLRMTARALGLEWPQALKLTDYERTLAHGDAAQATMMLAIRRAGQGASYLPYAEGKVPWHAAMAASYVHATAPLRRLADRYVVEAALAVANGAAVPNGVSAAFERLPKVMARAEARANQVERAVVDLAEAAMLDGREGESFEAVVTDEDERGVRIQLCTEPVVARVVARKVEPGERLRFKLVEADPVERRVEFARIG